MRIGLDAIPLVAAKTGVGHYAAALAEALARAHADHQYDLLSPFDFTLDQSNGHHVANLSKRFIPTQGVFRKWWLVGLPALLRITPLDLFHGVNYCVPVFAPCPTVVTIHDLSLYTQSITHETDNVRRGKRRMPLMARRATRIIAPSEFTRRETIEHLGVSEDKIQVIPEAARTHMRPLAPAECAPALEKYGISAPYLLYVGTIEPRKNLLTLLRAYDDLLRSTPHRPQLVLAGGRGWLCESVFDLVRELKLDDQVKFTGYVDDADLPALYSGCEIFLYPSLYEGFGLPPLEAMACGAPVITSNTSSIPEVVGDAGQLLGPNDGAGLTATMAKWLDDPAARRHYREAGLKRAALFSWERAARETQTLYHEAHAQWRRNR
ncbi:MAG: glycosyltransferase family 4 protein [Blastocatellia bacterium]